MFDNHPEAKRLASTTPNQPHTIVKPDQRGTLETRPTKHFYEVDFGVSRNKKQISSTFPTLLLLVKYIHISFKFKIETYNTHCFLVLHSSGHIIFWTSLKDLLIPTFMVVTILILIHIFFKPYLA